MAADFGCGDAQLASNVPQTVHSFDLVATAPGVIACNMANTPLGEVVKCDPACIGYLLIILGNVVSDSIPAVAVSGKARLFGIRSQL